MEETKTGETSHLDQPQAAAEVNLIPSNEHVHTPAGGLQGYQISPPNLHLDDRTLSGKWIRTWAVFTKILIPILLLICWSYFCGWLLVLSEYKQERDNNNSVLAFNYDKVEKLRYAVSALKDSQYDCISKFVNDVAGGSEIVNVTDLISYAETCTSAQVEVNEVLYDEISSSFLESIYADMSVEWNLCLNETIKDRNPWAQFEVIRSRWYDDFQQKWSNNMKNDQMSDLQAYLNALNEASGTDECGLNVPGGSVYWFTIMTTIGYGNTSVVTASGRLLVYTLGFLSVLAFTAVIGVAGSICIHIFDDFFLRREWNFLTKGIGAIIFWACSFFLWTLFVAGIAIAYGKSRADYYITLKDAFWWAYISVMTIGFGDFHIQHEYFRYGDMFYMPLIFLIGFVVLANFLLKLSEWFVSFHQKEGLDTILEKSRRAFRSNQSEDCDDP